MVVHTPKTMTILSSVLMLIGFFGTSCVGINLGDIPRGLRHPRDVPSVDPSTLSQKPYTYTRDFTVLCMLKNVLFMSIIGGLLTLSPPLIQSCMYSQRQASICGETFFKVTLLK